MIETMRHCPDCDQDQPFEPLHAQDGDCSDAADGSCPEWSCLRCGAGLLLGCLSYQRKPVRLERPRRLVA
jgi:hypothetical protein